MQIFKPPKSKSRHMAWTWKFVPRHFSDFHYCFQIYVSNVWLSCAVETDTLHASLHRSVTSKQLQDDSDLMNIQNPTRVVGDIDWKASRSDWLFGVDHLVSTSRLAKRNDISTGSNHVRVNDILMGVLKCLVLWNNGVQRSGGARAGLINCRTQTLKYKS